MLYHTAKDHLVRHVGALAARPTGSIWDYVPEPRLHIARPLINDARVGVVDPEEDAMHENEDRDDAENAPRCLGCGRFMHRDDDVYPCMNCHATPFHLECLEPHYQQAHPRPQQVLEEKERTKEEEILQKESEEARLQWVDQMTYLSRGATPRSRRITSIVVALVSVGLGVTKSWSSAAADAPVPLLQGKTVNGSMGTTQGHLGFDIQG